MCCEVTLGPYCTAVVYRLSAARWCGPQLWGSPSHIAPELHTELKRATGAGQDALFCCQKQVQRSPAVEFVRLELTACGPACSTLSSLLPSCAVIPPGVCLALLFCGLNRRRCGRCRAAKPTRSAGSAVNASVSCAPPFPSLPVPAPALCTVTAGVRAGCAGVRGVRRCAPGGRLPSCLFSCRHPWYAPPPAPRPA